MKIKKGTNVDDWNITIFMLPTALLCALICITYWIYAEFENSTGDGNQFSLGTISGVVGSGIVTLLIVLL